MKKAYLHSMFIDFNSFFASVEQADRPELRGRPVVVVPLLADTTCCIAASREAKPFGIKTGTPVYEAKRLCPGLAVVEARPEPYILFQRKLNETIAGCGVSPQEASIDEVHCQLWGEWMEPEAARALALRIKAAIAESVSPILTCSIGIAPNRFLSKTASDMEKPDGLVVILPDELPDKLHGLELRDLCGIGPRMEARLRAHAIDTVAQLCAVSREMLRAVWGSVEGELFHDSLHGQATSHRPTERRSLGHSHILPPELRHEPGARSVLHRLTQKAGKRLRVFRCVTARMSIFIKCQGERESWSDEMHFAPTQDALELLHTLEMLWARRRLGAAAVPFAVGVNFMELADERNAVPALFERERGARRRALLAAVDQINHKEGKNSAYFAGAHGAVKYTPMRIAFNRIPDPETEG